MPIFANLDFSASSVASRRFLLFLRKKSHLRIAQIRLRRGLVGEANYCLLNLPEKESPTVCAWAGEGVNLPGLAFAAGNLGKVFNCCTTYTFPPPPQKDMSGGLGRRKERERKRNLKSEAKKGAECDF